MSTIQSPGHADVTEGSRGIWERLDYLGKRRLGNVFRRAVNAIEARNGVATA